MDSSENSLSSCTDEQLLLKIRSGESDGCEAQTLVKRYMSIVKLKAAKTAVHCPSADIDDLFSDGLMGLLKAIRYYNPEKGASFATFANLCISSSIKTAAAKAVRSSPLSKADDFDWELLEDAGISTEDAVIDKEQDGELYRRLSDILTPRELAVLQLYLRHFTYQQTADALSISEKSVDNALQRAKTKIKHTLGK